MRALRRATGCALLIALWYGAFAFISIATRTEMAAGLLVATLIGAFIVLLMLACRLMEA